MLITKEILKSWKAANSTKVVTLFRDEEGITCTRLTFKHTELIDCIGEVAGEVSYEDNWGSLDPDMQEAVVHFFDCPKLWKDGTFEALRLLLREGDRLDFSATLHKNEVYADTGLRDEILSASISRKGKRIIAYMLLNSYTVNSSCSLWTAREGTTTNA
jgi:hypothetical protein